MFGKGDMSDDFERVSMLWQRLLYEDYLKIEIVEEEVVTDVGVFQRGQQIDTLPKELRNQLLESNRAKMVFDVSPEMGKLLQSPDTVSH